MSAQPAPEHDRVAAAGEAAATASAPGAAEARHLRPVDDAPAKPQGLGLRYYAVAPEISRALGAASRPALIYAVLATKWFEYADVKKLDAGIVPGDWVEVEYSAMMEISGTTSCASIARWLRVLTEERHPCPWGCDGEHPLVVSRRQGQGKGSRYRKWRCGEDQVAKPKARIRSPRLSAVAKQRVALGFQLNAMSTKGVAKSDQLTLASASGRDPEVSSREFSEVSPREPFISPSESSGALAARVQDLSGRESQTSPDETSLRERSSRTGKTSGTVAKSAAAADGVEDEAAPDVDALACEVIELIVTLARRREPSYPEARAWAVSRSLAASVLDFAGGVRAKARALLLAAIASKKLDRYDNPVGLLISGIVGDGDGGDRFLLEGVSAQSGVSAPVAASAGESASGGVAPGTYQAILSALRDGKTFTEEELRAKDIPPAAIAAARAELAGEASRPSVTPLVDQLERKDPRAYRERLEVIARDLELPAGFGKDRSLDRPLVRGMARSRLEGELKASSAAVAGGELEG